MSWWYDPQCATSQKSTNNSVSELRMSASRLGSDLRSLEDSQARALAQVNKQLTSDVTVMSGTMDIKVRVAVDWCDGK
jgi:hypothetical protein